MTIAISSHLSRMFLAAKFVLVLCLLKQPHLAGKKSFFFLLFLCFVPPTRFCCFEVSYFTHHVILKACCRTLLVQSLLLCINSNQTMTQTNSLHSFYFLFLTDSIADPTITCKRFVPEGDPLNCECEARVVGDYPADFSLTWPGRSTNPTLDIPYVKRQHNGTTYICLLVWNGEKRTASYTLQVACQSVISVCDLVNTRYTSPSFYLLMTT